ncbi:hypothetical protein [Azospirillum sp. B510]|uniref:hypothetical protein n=1 Tax=Azospirillum sp. (strain B510) TaxID=137722 RepID=UPI0005A8EBFF|nr:hypothetical protein [Azospirillum sp. B510]
MATMTAVDLIKRLATDSSFRAVLGGGDMKAKRDTLARHGFAKVEAADLRAMAQPSAVAGRGDLAATSPSAASGTGESSGQSVEAYFAAAGFASAGFAAAGFGSAAYGSSAFGSAAYSSPT